MKVYGDRISGNCLKVAYTADYLGLRYEWVDVDINKGESRTPEFLALNPQGQVPVVSFPGNKTLAQSNAIIRFLAQGTALLPADPFAAAKVDEALFWEQYSHEPYIAVCRFQMLYAGRSLEERDQWRVERGEQTLDAMNTHLATRSHWCDSGLSIADVSLVAYTQFAHEGGFDLAGRAHVQRWVRETQQALGITP